MEKICMKE